MIMNVIVVLVIAIVGYVGLTRGFFGSMLNMVCVVIGAAWRRPSSAVETNMQVRTSFMIDWTVSSDSGLDAALVVCV